MPELSAAPVETMQGTEILPVSVVRTCEYDGGCDEVAMPGSTCCWRHRRMGRLFPPTGQPLPARVQTKSEAPVIENAKCGCGRDANHRGRCEWRRRNHSVREQISNGNGARSIQVSAEARDALRAKTPDADDPEDTLPLFTVKMTEPMLDTFWGLLDGKSKAALLSKMGAE